MIPLFPNFNIYSSPLLFLVLQGLLFAFLLWQRYYKERYVPDALLATVLLITCWHRTTYTVGFLGWYDDNRNTKINYYLISCSLALAPLLYLYVKSVTVSGFKLIKQHIYHFIPFLIFLAYKIFLLIYDANQPGFTDTQNGVLMQTLDNDLIFPIVEAVENMQMILYLAFTFQALYHYKKKISQYYSNTFKLELNWLRNFLFIYAFLYIYSVSQLAISLLISDLHWTQKWWYHFFSGLAIIYIGIKGYFTKTSKLQDLDFNTFATPPASAVKAESTTYEADILKIKAFFVEDRPYLNPELNLKNLAKELSYSTNQLSEIINSGFNLNFNDFVNGYRVEAVKKALQAGKQKEMSLVGIAMNCGFNSKPTFNRVFKKLVGTSPSQYAQTQST